MADSGASGRNAKPLSLKERAFLAELFACGLNTTEAFVSLSRKLGKEVTRDRAASEGWKLRKRICQTVEFREVLAERGLDQATLADDLNRLRVIQRPAFNRDGVHVGDFDDGQVQLGAAKLLSETLGVSSKDLGGFGPVEIRVVLAPELKPEGE